MAIGVKLDLFERGFHFCVSTYSFFLYIFLFLFANLLFYLLFTNLLLYLLMYIGTSNGLYFILQINYLYNYWIILCFPLCSRNKNTSSVLQ